jgi:hypothetical protein
MRSDRWPESRPSIRPSPTLPTLFAQRYTGAMASVGSNTQVSRLHYSLSETKTLGESEVSAANRPFACLFAANRS